MTTQWLKQRRFPALASLLLIILLSGCSQNSAPTNQTTPPPVGSDDEVTSVEYKGLPPSAVEVQTYLTNVWANVAREDRCGACHVEGQQYPHFARADDIDLAYQDAITIIDLDAPTLSRMVAKVSGGHQCWRAEPTVCGDTLQTWIDAWVRDIALAKGEELETEQILLLPPDVKPVGNSLPFPESSQAFEQLVYTPFLKPYCSECHSPFGDTPQQPYFASSDVDAAYEAAKSKVKLSAPERSRMVVRLAEESHNCWTANCASDSVALSEAIAAIAAGVEPVSVDPAFVTSNALQLVADGLLANTGGRVENNIIAKYEFKTGSGDFAYDTSGVDPALDLRISGDAAFLDGGVWGLRFYDDDGSLNPDNGRAQGSTDASKKLHRRITFTGEYTIEAWVAPANVTQEGPARIVSYSGGGDIRNFTLGQTLYNYDFLNRSSETNLNGQPMVSTPNADEVLQATLQHVAVTYSILDGRKIYVNGELITQEDVGEDGAASLAGWDDTFALILGTETSGFDPWLGTIRFLGIHNRALTLDSVVANYDAGVGETFFMLFRVTDSLIEGSIPAGTDAYIVFETEPFDSYSYLFANPFFFILDPNQLTGSTAAPLRDIRLKGMRIGINGQEPLTGQAFATLDTTITAADYVPGVGQKLSSIGALIPIEQGKEADEFFLTFDQLSDSTFARPADPVPALPESEDTPEELRLSHIGMKTFAEINASLSLMTGVPVTNAEASETYSKVQQQLLVDENIEGFLPAHHMGITQLSVAYCSALIKDAALRAARFPGFDFTATHTNAFDAAGRANFIGQLTQALVVAAPNDTEIASGPSGAELQTYLEQLIDQMTACGVNCTDGTTINTAIATCAAAMGSAAMLIQ